MGKVEPHPSFLLWKTGICNLLHPTWSEYKMPLQLWSLHSLCIGPRFEATWCQDGRNCLRVNPFSIARGMRYSVFYEGPWIAMWSDLKRKPRCNHILIVRWLTFNPKMSLIIYQEVSYPGGMEDQLSLFGGCNQVYTLDCQMWTLK